MAWSTPRTWVAGETLTASILNTHVRDNLSFLYTPPMCRVRNSASISIATSGVSQALTFNSERFDTDSMHSTTVDTSRVNTPTAGKYLFTGHVQFASGGGNYRETFVRLSGATIVAHLQLPPVGGGIVTAMSIATAYACLVTNYAELVVAQDTGGALNVTSAPNYSPEFSAIWLGN